MAVGRCGSWEASPFFCTCRRHQFHHHRRHLWAAASCVCSGAVFDSRVECRPGRTQPDASSSQLRPISPSGLVRCRSPPAGAERQAWISAAIQDSHSRFSCWIRCTFWLAGCTGGCCGAIHLTIRRHDSYSHLDVPEGDAELPGRLRALLSCRTKKSQFFNPPFFVLR